MPKSYKTIEIMQQTEYGFTPDFVSCLVADWSVVKDYAYILHDKDTRTDGSFKAPHIHLMLRFRDSVPTTAILAKLDGVCKEEHLEKCKKWSSALAYLTHANRPERHQYDPSEVVSNFDWETEAVVSFDLDDFLLRLDSGEIREYNLFDFIGALDYAKHEKKIQSVLKYRYNRLQAQQQKGVISMKTSWFSGEAGTGKTMYARFLAKLEGFDDVYITSSGNDPFGEYKGQRYVIWDDVRPRDTSVGMLLKLLDPNCRTAVKSRYFNKWLDIERLVVTSPASPDDFWKELTELGRVADGDKRQLLRRLNGGWFHFKPVLDVTATAYTPSGVVAASVGVSLSADFVREYLSRNDAAAADYLSPILGLGFDVKPKPEAWEQKTFDDDELPF